MGAPATNIACRHLFSKGFVMGSFMCRLDWPWGAQIKRYFWVCLDEINIGVCGLSKVDGSPQWGWAPANPLRA